MPILVSMIHDTQNFIQGRLTLTPAFIDVLQNADLNNIIIELTIKTVKDGVLVCPLLEGKK